MWNFSRFPLSGCQASDFVLLSISYTLTPGILGLSVVSGRLMGASARRRYDFLGLDSRKCDGFTVPQ